MRRATATVVVLLLSLAGCAGAPDRADGPLASASESGVPSASGTEVPVEPGATSVPVEREPSGGGGPQDGDGGGSGHGGGPGDGGGTEDERDIRIGGPTLDNTFPTNPYALPHPGGSSCVLFSNATSDVTVSVRSVALVEQQPTADPGLVLGSEPGAHPQCGPHFQPEGVRTVHPRCDGATLEPAQRSVCPVAVQSVGAVGTDYTARLVLRLAATCTDLTGEPCGRLTGLATPTSAEAVTVVWEDSRRYASCLVPRDRDGAEFLPEEGDGRCPVEDPTDPSPRSEPPAPQPSPTEETPEPGGETTSPGTTTDGPTDAG